MKFYKKIKQFLYILQNFTNNIGRGEYGKQTK